MWMIRFLLVVIGPRLTKIDAMIENLAIDLELTQEGDLATFLGIQMNKSTENGSLKLTSTQEGLIKRVLQATGLEDCRASRWAPWRSCGKIPCSLLSNQS